MTTYTYEQIGQRIMERNPDAFKGLNVTASQVGQRAVQRNPDAFKGLVNDTATKAGTTPAAPTADQISAKQTGAFFPANTQNPSLAVEPLKVVGNLAPSAFNFAKGAVDLVNPVSTVQKLGNIVSGFGALKGEKAAAQQSEQAAADSTNRLIQRYQQMQAAGQDTSHIESYFRANGIDYSKYQTAPKVTPRNDTFGSFIKELPGAAVTSLVPDAGRAIGRVAQGYVTGNDQMIDENLQRAQRDIVNDPVGSILPFILAAKGGAKALDKAGLTAGAEAAFDTGVSKTAKPVLNAGETVFGKASEAAGGVKNLAEKGVKYGIGQATGLQPDTITQIIQNPDSFTKASRGTIDRAGLGQEVQSALSKRLADLEETGKAYEGVRDLKAPNLEVANATQKVIKNGKMSYVYDLKDAPNESLSLPELRAKLSMLEKDTSGAYSKAEIGAIQDIVTKRQAAEPLNHTVQISPTYLENTIRANTGLKFSKGQFETSGSAAIREARDVRALQNLYDTWKPTFEKGKLTTQEFLNFRSDLAKLSKFEREISSSSALENLSKKMRATFNDKFRSKIPGLEELDTKFSAEKSELKQLSKGIVDKDGNLTDSALNKIANATGKGKDALLARLEETVPGITKKIKILKAVEDIEHASGIKVGTYTRGAIVGAGFLAGGPITALINAVLTSPELAVPMLRKYGMIKNSAAVTLVGQSLKAGKNLLQLGAAKVNKLPEKTPELVGPSVFGRSGPTQ